MGGHVELTPPQAVSGEDLYLELLYSSESGHELPLAVDRGEGYAGVHDHVVVLEPGDKGRLWPAWEAGKSNGCG